jgi:hypothetical protein
MKPLTINPYHGWSGGKLHSLGQLAGLMDEFNFSKTHRPRVHGNGFIQLDLDDRVRLHVFGDLRIPRQKFPTPIHDHVFGFTSHVLSGRMINVEYEEGPWPGLIEAINLPIGNFYEPHTRMLGEDLCEDTVLQQRDPGTYGLFVNDTQIVHAGEEYRCDAGTLHESVTAEITVTLIQKDGPTVAQGAAARPRVFVPVGGHPDNEFNRYDAAPVEMLWHIISDALKQAA